MREAAGRRGHEAIALPLGVDTDAWPPLEPRPRDAARPARLLHVASLNAVKDQRTLIHALAELRDRRVDFIMDVAGEDTMGGAARREAEEVGLGASVRFHGFLAHGRLRPLFETADVLVVSSRHEAGPLVLAEAAVAGVPTVGTAVGQIADWSPDAAVAVAPGDATALASAIEELLSDDARRLRIASAAQRRALAEDADTTARRVLALYETLGTKR
jgi:glycosyltransferase involved in cell wall biosynthesis